MSKRLIITQGLPASGKTTWALAQMAECLANNVKAVRINQDEIRKEMGWTSWRSWDFKSPLEKSVHTIKMKRLLDALRDSDVSVIISDDTNLSRRTRQAIEGIGRQFFANVEIHKFDTSVDECIRRDSLRPEPQQVGMEVIREMAIKHGLLGLMSGGESYPVYLPDKMQKSAIVCDLDGTLALNTHGRSFYDASTCDKDACCEEVRVILEVFYRMMGWDIIYLSGREEAYRDKTQTFLQLNHCPPGKLFMRKNGDHRKDAIIKNEIFEERIAKNWFVRLTIDDRNQVVSMWRKKGIKCFQVADGDF